MLSVKLLRNAFAGVARTPVTIGELLVAFSKAALAELIL